MLSLPAAFAKSKMRPQLPVFDDLNQNEKDMPLVPVVNGVVICTYWLLAAFNNKLPVPTCLSLLDIEAPFINASPREEEKVW